MELLTVLTNFAATESSGESEGIAALGIDPFAILAQAATFLLLFWVIKKFALDKIVTTLEKRRQTIDDGVRLGRQMEAEKERLDEKVEQALKQARNEADQIIAESREEAGAVIKQAEVTASAKVDTMLVEAHHKIEEDIDAARKGLEQEMRVLVAEATEAIIQEKLDAKKDASLLDRALAKVRAS
jgi:F-type H+-transporting ATPase subunit b